MPTQSYGVSFKGQKIYAGIDVHLHQWNIAIMVENMRFKPFQQPPSAKALYEHLHSHYPDAEYHSAYEAGFSGFETHRELLSYGIQNLVINASDIPTTQKDTIYKTDSRDSTKIVMALHGGLLKGIYVPQRATLEARSIVRVRKSIVLDLTRIKNRTKSLLYSFGIVIPNEFYKNKNGWTLTFIKWLETDAMVLFQEDNGRKSLDYLLNEVKYLRKQQLEITKQLRLLEQSDKYGADITLLRSVPGIGLINAVSLVLEIEDINRFKRTDDFASFIGLVPTCHSSGEKQSNGSITFRAKATLRRDLMEASWVAVYRDPALTKLFLGYCKRMPKTNAIVRIARKLSNRIYYVLKHKRKYELGIEKQ